MTRINLLRPRLPSREAREVRLLRGATLLLTVCLLLSLAAWGTARRAAHALARELASADRALSAMAADLDRWQALRQEEQASRTRLEALDAALPDAIRLTPVVEEIAAALEGTCRLERIAVSPQEGVILRGRAPSYAAAADCVERLRQLPSLASVALQAAEPAQSSGGVSFHVTGELAQGEGGGGE